MLVLLESKKNHKFLLKIFSKLDDPNAVLILIGDGVLKPEIQKKVFKIWD